MRRKVTPSQLPPPPSVPGSPEPSVTPHPSSSSPLPDALSAPAPISPPAPVVSDSSETHNPAFSAFFSPVNNDQIENLENLQPEPPPVDRRRFNEHYNFFFCKGCSGFWGRVQTPYVNILMEEQEEWDLHFPQASDRRKYPCETCSGERFEKGFTTPNGEYQSREFYEGSYTDSTGDWLYVGSVVEPINVTGEEMFKATLVPLFAGQTPTFAEFYLCEYEPMWHVSYRSRQLRREAEKGQPRFRTSRQVGIIHSDESATDSDDPHPSDPISPSQNAPCAQTTPPCIICLSPPVSGPLGLIPYENGPTGHSWG